MRFVRSFPVEETKKVNSLFTAQVDGGVKAEVDEVVVPEVVAEVPVLDAVEEVVVPVTVDEVEEVEEQVNAVEQDSLIETTPDTETVDEVAESVTDMAQDNIVDQTWNPEPIVAANEQVPFDDFVDSIEPLVFRDPEPLAADDKFAIPGFDNAVEVDKFVISGDMEEESGTVAGEVSDVGCLCDSEAIDGTGEISGAFNEVLDSEQPDELAGAFEGYDRDGHVNGDERESDIIIDDLNGVDALIPDEFVEVANSRSDAEAAAEAAEASDVSFVSEDEKVSVDEKMAEDVWEKFVDNVIMPTLNSCVDRLKDFLNTELVEDLRKNNPNK